MAGATAELPVGRRVRALLGWLAVHPGRHARSRLASQFWPDVLEASARASLRSAIWALRSALGPDFGSCLATDRDTVTLAADGLWIDLREVRRLIGQGQPGSALDLCRGELLQELDDDWVVEAREELDRDVAAALRDLMAQAAAAGDSAAAVGWARRRAALCPLDESAGADLIRALLQAGDPPGAVAALARLRERLDSELGIGVSAATTALVSGLDRPADGGRRTDAGRNAHRGAAPAERVVEPVAGLVGRQQNVDELVKAWQTARSGSGGAVLLEGEGGIGKTRLVEELRAAAERGAPGATLIAGTTAAGPGRDAPFAIWTDALSDLVSVTGPPPTSLAWTADLARIVPALAQAAAGTGPATRTSADPRLERVQLCEAVVQFLAWASGRAPLLLAFEDLHQSDLASLELIAYTGRRLSRQTFDESAVSAAPPEQVWKLLYDPAQFPLWWAGTGSVEVETDSDCGGYTMYPEGYPDFPMPQALTTSRENGAVKISCLVSDLCFDWRLRPCGSGTEISAHVEIPDREARRLDSQRDIIRRSLRQLADDGA